MKTADAWMDKWFQQNFSPVDCKSLAQRPDQARDFIYDIQQDAMNHALGKDDDVFILPRLPPSLWWGDISICSQPKETWLKPYPRSSCVRIQITNAPQLIENLEQAIREAESPDLYRRYK